MFEHQLIDEADRRPPAHRPARGGGRADPARRRHPAAPQRRRPDHPRRPEIVRARPPCSASTSPRPRLLSPNDPELRERFAAEYHERRKHKGIDLERARDIVIDVSYFGTMMVELGLADGMVSGAAHTTAHTIRPALEVVRTVPDVSVVSSVFFMCLRDQVLVYGDCAVNPDPTAAQLADIALASARTAAAFGVEPRVAMLSYSTGGSGCGTDVDKVIEATAMVRERAPDLLVEGPIQYDAAIDAAVARTKLPDSQVAGRATVFVFPDLNTGNNTYKAVQRSAGALAVGPVLQGLRKPVNDLSRGALVRDIVNTVAITAIQAQERRSLTDRDVLVLNAGSSSLKYSLVDGETGSAGVRVGRADRRGPGALTHAVGGRQHTEERASPTFEDALGSAVDAFEDHGPAIDRDRAGRGRAPGRARRRAVLRADAGRRPRGRDRRGPRPARAAAQPGQPRGHRGRAAAVPRPAAGGGLRHRLPPDDAGGRLHLRRPARAGARSTGSGATASTARRTPSSRARAARLLGRAVEDTNLVVLHLGNGASATAVRGGRSVDTSMGLTPLEGLVMGTRSGDLDPAVHSHLHRSLGWSLDDIDRALNRESGLHGLAGDNDFREVMQRRARG